MENLVKLTDLSSFYKGKKVMLTGHTGFKGSWLWTWLHLLGATVKGYALEPEQEEGLFQQVRSLSWGESVIADIRDRDRVRAEILHFQPDLIFHLAAQPLVRRSYQIPAETFDVNVVGTANVLEPLCQLNKACAVLVITTDKVYENLETGHLYQEDDVLGGYDPYSSSKACTELVVQSFRRSFFQTQASGHASGIQLASARAGNVIGGGDFSEDRIIPDIVRALRAERPIEVRNPSSIRPWQHVLEPLAGYLQLAAMMYQQPGQYDQAFNFGPNPQDHLTVAEITELAITAWGQGTWESKSPAQAPHEAGILKLNIQKSKEALHWSPKLQAAESIRWTINWYKQKEDLPEFTRSQIRQYMQL